MTEAERTPRVPLSEDMSVIALTREVVAHALEEFPTEATSDGTAGGVKRDWMFAEETTPAALFERQPVSQFAAWSSTLMHEAPPPQAALPPVIQLPYRSIAIACAITVLVGLIVVATGPLVRSVTSGARPSTATNAVPPSTVASLTPPRPHAPAPVATRTSVNGTRSSTTPTAPPPAQAARRTATSDDALTRVRAAATDRAARQAAAERARRAGAAVAGTGRRGTPATVTNAMPPVTAASSGRPGVATRADTVPPAGNATTAALAGTTAAASTIPRQIDPATTSPARSFPAGASAATAPPTLTSSAPAPSAPAVPAPAASAPVAVAPAATTDRQVIDAVLGRYRTAFNELDAVGAQAIWPTVDRRALERAFGQLEQQNVRFTSCAIEVAGSVASARCTGRTNYVPRVGNRGERSENREWQFSLRKAGDQWNIASVQTR